MRLIAGISAALLLMIAVPAYADLAAIHRDRLPQTASVLSALDDAQQLEPYTDHWSAKWNYPVPEQKAAARLGMDLGVLKAALKEHPENEELLLLTGLVAHYAYSVDLGGADTTYDTVLQSLTEAAKLNASDIRPEWFRADFLCQTSDPVPGAMGFLNLEATHDWRVLPAAFWDNYLACALVTNMPAHVLRAADYLAQDGAPPSRLPTFYTNAAHERFTAVDLTKTYDSKQAWYTTAAGADWDFTSTACGLRFRVRASWRVGRLEIQNGTCVAVFSTGPYIAPRGPLSPEILVISRGPEGQETLEDFLHLFTKKGTFKTVVPPHCPATTCLAMNGFQSGVYGKDGDALPRVVAFERDEPRYPGLLFESPEGPPTSSSGAGVQYFRPDQTLQRIPGRLYYFITLDTASSIEPQAVSDFDFFLQHVQVE